MNSAYFADVQKKKKENVKISIFHIKLCMRVGNVMLFNVMNSNRKANQVINVTYVS